MSDPRFILLYVQTPARSTAFYAGLLGKPAIEASPNFAMFALEGGVTLGLWAAREVQPPATAVGGAELAFPVADRSAVLALHERWRDQGLPIAQPPTPMDFGFTFVALDPDGHRLRVFAPAGAP